MVIVNYQLSIVNCSLLIVNRHILKERHRVYSFLSCGRRRVAPLALALFQPSYQLGRAGPVGTDGTDVAGQVSCHQLEQDHVDVFENVVHRPPGLGGQLSNHAEEAMGRFGVSLR